MRTKHHLVSFGRRIALLFGSASFLAAATEHQPFSLPLAPSAIVQNHPALLAFAQAVSETVEEQLSSASMDPLRLKLLHGIRVHAGLLLGDDARALDSATRIRQLQTAPADRAFAGLMTEAIVAARRATGSRADAADFAAAFSAYFRQRLKALPATSDVLTMLQQQRERTASLNRRTLLDEAGRIEISPATGTHCTWEETDQIIRIAHKMITLLPLREPTLDAFDIELAARARR